MQKLAILILVALTVQLQAKRLHVDLAEAAKLAVEETNEAKVEVDEEKALAELEKAEEEQALAEDRAEEEREAVVNPQDAYWYKNQGSWAFLAPLLMTSPYLQQFELKEDYRLFRTKKYDAKLQEFEDPMSGIEVRKHINAKVMRVENYFWTMHAHQSAVFKNEAGVVAGEYIMFTPHVINRRYTWRVAKIGEEENILFTIQKRLYSDHCKYLDMFSCRPVLKIYVGHKGDKSTLIYYGVGDKDLEEPDFKFYHAKEEYKTNKRNWVAKVDHKKTKGKFEEDVYKVKVKPHEDAALILLASVCLDKIGDDSRMPDHDD